MIKAEQLSINDWTDLIETYRSESKHNLREWPYLEAARLRNGHFGNRVYLRGLIEISSYCGRDCYYCGIRKSNGRALRYRLNQSEIMTSCTLGYELGFQTFVLQGGEDGWFTDAVLCELVSGIKEKYPSCAVTLSLGERTKASYLALKAAGADRYLLRHETADPVHFGQLHPAGQTFESRKRCLYDLREAGFQVGAGFMVGSPGQTTKQLADDLQFLIGLNPHMVGIGPFIPHRDTPLRDQPPGELWDTLLMLALVRIALPQVLLPATTALGSIHPDGREQGLLAGANVVMPNLTPPVRRSAYNLYDGKLSFGAESAEGLQILNKRLAAAGFRADMSRGDHSQA